MMSIQTNIYKILVCLLVAISFAKALAWISVENDIRSRINISRACH
jgi:hypothetical protein